MGVFFFLFFFVSRRRVPRDDVDAGFFSFFFIDPVSIGDGALDARTSPVETRCVCVRHRRERCDVFPRAGPRECMNVRGDVAWIHSRRGAGPHSASRDRRAIGETIDRLYGEWPPTDRWSP